MIRKATIPDVRAIHKLLMTYASSGMMLSRSLSELYEAIRDFYVWEEDGVVVGTVCLHICWEDLAEVRSLAVEESFEGRGIGRQLVESCLQEARQIGLKKVFALTYKDQFFAKLGFHLIEKSELPHKIWGDCIKCPKFPECDEIAMSIELL
ncbi:MAG: GNAT family N-acetyltransferase [Deltaproteobacteria bacterium HGW-Deltaproteobacteria-4]|nr:MAG: GNAT family N-acetyltransferase [Deltaproteobacteria bacterium HGW-Deltaproteobacteria-4]